ncbi:MAG: hypothetical protein IPM54_42615 [Polyangiaceae bacterium]|nr:hypothetical protein [Polyangiaceae bacterium]
MSKVTGAAYAGPLEISLKDLDGHLIDLPKNAMQRLRSAQDGIDEVITELAQSVPLHGENAGITTKVYQSFVDDTAIIEKLEAGESELEKLLEVVRESRAKKVHNRENTIAQMADAAKSTAHRTGDKSILAPFEKTIRYNSQIAEKAAQTRRKNAEAKAEEGTPPDGNGTP